MLLRTASTPILRSCSHQPTLSPEPDLGLRIQTTRPTSLSPKSIMSMSRTSSETDLRQLSALKKRPLSHNSLVMSPVLVEEQEEMETESFLGGGNSVGVVEDRKKEKVAVGGGVVGGGSGGCWGGGGENSGHQNESMDGYYQKMIRKYPNDGLLLVNYARFLKEVKGDVVKAEEYCERAILAKAVDGDVLSLYGDLIWSNYKDASKAQSYFDQAVQSAPNDCYVLASYAQFLWDAGEEEEEEEEDHDHDDNASDCKIKLNLSKGCPSSSPLAAAS